MSLRTRQLAATADALPSLVSLAPLAWATAAALVVVALMSSPASVVTHTRVAAAAAAAAAAGLLDDTAAVTLAASPTPLLTRRSFRIVIVAVTVAGWWSLMVIVAVARGADIPIVALSRELVVLVALSVAGAVLVQRVGGAGGSGALGGMLAIGWFVLSFLPGIAWLPSIPNPLAPGAATPLSVVVLVAAAATILLSRDPAAGRSVGR